MWRATYSPLYHIVSEWGPVFPLAEKLSGGGCKKPQARPIAKKSLWGSSLEPLTGFCLAVIQNWITRTLKATWRWRNRRRKGNCTKWPRFTTFWRCGRAAKTNVLHRRNLALKTWRWLPWDTFRHRGDCQSILVTLSTWWCGCIQIVRKISFATTFICKGRPWRTNSHLKCPPNRETQPLPSRQWRG